MTFQLVPPYNNRRNSSDKAIQIWKDHFIGVMIRTTGTFPVHLWYQAISQAERQLLLLRQSHVHPKVSAYPQVYRLHGYNTTPFVPIGMEKLVHDKPN